MGLRAARGRLRPCLAKVPRSPRSPHWLPTPTPSAPRGCSGRPKACVNATVQHASRHFKPAMTLPWKRHEKPWGTTPLTPRGPRAPHCRPTRPSLTRNEVAVHVDARPADGNHSRPPSSTSSGWSAKGCPNKDIATRLFVSPRTVQTHLTHVYAKLAVSSRVQLVQEAARHT
jgi:hypothetical protein